MLAMHALMTNQREKREEERERDEGGEKMGHSIMFTNFYGGKISGKPITTNLKLS